MKGILFVLMMVAAQGAAAQTVTLTSGEHGAFTRLVIDAGGAADWAFGRTETGYEISLGESRVRYDLSKVFDKITRNRIGSVSINPDSGLLQLGIVCACFATPFELAPGTIVVDVREGPPPQGTSFETSLGGAVMPALTEADRPRPRARPERTNSMAGYEWQSLPGTAPAPLSLPLMPSQTADLAEVKNTLLRQLSDGASRGVVDLELPQRKPEAGPTSGHDVAPQVRIGENLGLVSGLAMDEPKKLTQVGDACFPDDEVDLGTWGHEDRIPDQFADAKQNLAGEFDKPDPEAVARAARFYIYLGFGAEAYQVLTAFRTESRQRDRLLTLSLIMEGKDDPDGAFAGMAACDNAAALWSILADPSQTRAQTLNKRAVLRTFSGLPLHLRRYLGARLAEEFRLEGDLQTATTLVASIVRGPGNPGPAVRLTEAELKIARGEDNAAALDLADLSSDAGPEAVKAKILMVSRQIDSDDPIDPLSITTFDALAQEYKGTEMEPSLRLVQTKARAALGDFDGAFDRLPATPDAAETVWRLLVKAPEAPFLTHATAVDEAERRKLPLVLRRDIATRLLEGGFGSLARSWLQSEADQPGQADPKDRLLLAQAALQERNPALVRELLAGLSSGEALNRMAEAEMMAGNTKTAARSFEELGDVVREQHATRVSAEWPQIAATTDDPWAPAARLLVPGDVAEPAQDGTAGTSGQDGPLAQSRALVTESATARQTLSDLLAIAKGP